MATPEEEVQKREQEQRDRARLNEYRERIKAHQESTEAPAEVPALQPQPDIDPQQAGDDPTPSWVGKDAPALSRYERLQKIDYNTTAEAALAAGDPIPEPGDMYRPGEGKTAFGDAKTTARIALMTPVAGYLSRSERELQLRDLAKTKVGEQIPADDMAGIEALAGKKLKDMRWRELDRYAERFYRDSGQVWENRIGHMAGYRYGQEPWATESVPKENAPDDVRLVQPKGEPAFEMAPELIQGARTSSGFNFYEAFVRPKFSNDTPELAENMVDAIREVSKDYTPELKERLDKTMTAKDAIWYNPMTYFDEDTKDPFHDLTAFTHTLMQQSGNFAAMIVAARTGGRIGARSYTKSIMQPGLKNEAIQKAQQIGGRIGGGAAGGKSEMMLIRDGVFMEAHDRIRHDLPEEVWDNHQPYLDLIDGKNGLSREEAKQVIAYQHANNAGDTAMIISGAALGTPMGMFYGGLTARSAGRQVAKESIKKQMLKGGLKETGQEMSQEFSEAVISNLGVSRVDPDQDIFEGGLEAVVQAMFISVAPGALGGIRSERGAGISKERDELIRKSQAYANAANERWKHQNKIGPNTAFAKDASPQDQLKAMIELERLQKKEAEEFLKVSKDARILLEKTGADKDSVLKFDAMQAGYEKSVSMIAKQQKRRSESRRQLRQERKVQQERADASKQVGRDVTSLNDALRLVEDMFSVQRSEALNTEQYAELEENGYGHFINNGADFVLTPRGRRAIPELQSLASSLSEKVQSGYAGEERRVDPARRERIAALSPDELESELYTDSQTQLRNKRAWDEESKDAPAVAIVDADSLKWVNDNLSHSAGNDFLEAVTKEFRELGPDVAAYRIGGDEFAITAPDMEALENAVESAAGRIAQAPRIEEGGQSVQPAITIGYGTTEKEADQNMLTEKEAKVLRGERADRGEAPTSFRVAPDMAGPQMTLFAGPKDPDHKKAVDDDMREADYGGRQSDFQWETGGFWEQKTNTQSIQQRAKFHKREVSPTHRRWIAETIDEFLPSTNSQNPPITVVQDPHELMLTSEDRYQELLDIGFSVWGVRGMFSLDDPSDGVFMIASNIIAQAESELTKGQKIRGWRESRWSAKKGDQVEVMLPRGKTTKGIITEVIKAPSEFQRIGAQVSMQQQRVRKQMRKKEAHVRDLRNRLNNLEKKADSLSDEDYNNFDHPLIIQIDDATTELYTAREKLHDLLWEENKISARKTSAYKPPDISKDRIKVALPDGSLVTFNPNTNRVEAEEDVPTGAAASATISRLSRYRNAKNVPTKREAVEIAEALSDAGRLNAEQEQELAELFEAAPRGVIIFPPEWGVQADEVAVPQKQQFAAVYSRALSHYKVSSSAVARQLQKGQLRKMKIGRIRGRAVTKGAKGFASFWHTNLGNVAVSMDEELTRDHVAYLVADTLMHESLGHYGIRGITQDYATYERLTHSLVDAFPEEVRRLKIMGYGYRKEFSASQNKALLGEEIVAWNVGAMFGDQALLHQMTPIQRTALQRFMLWFKEQLMKLGYHKLYNRVRSARAKRISEQIKALPANDPMRKKLTARRKKIVDTGFLKDQDLVTLIARIHDYVRNGGQKWQFLGEDGNMHKVPHTALPVRDMDIFRKPVHHVVKEGMRPLDEDEILTDEELTFPVGGGAEVISLGEAYTQVTGNQMPSDFELITISSFKDEAKRIEAEMTEGKTKDEIKQMRKDRVFPNPKDLFERNVPESKRELINKIDRILKSAAKEEERRVGKIRSKKAKIEKLVKVWGKEAVESGQVPLFPERGTVQTYLEAVAEVVDRGYMTKMEVEASGILNKLWPSKVDHILASTIGITEESLMKEMGITKKRFAELRQSHKPMTKDEAEGVKRAVDGSGLYKNWTVESIMNNNAMSLNEAAQYFIETQPHMPWAISLLGPRHETAIRARAALKIINGRQYSVQEKSTATKTLSDIAAETIDPTGKVFEKGWLLNTIKAPEYRIVAGDPEVSARTEEEIYNQIEKPDWAPATYQEFFSSYDPTDKKQFELRVKIQEEINLDQLRGLDRGYNKYSDEWFDPIQSFNYNSAYENLNIPGGINGTYRVAAFVQIPHGNAQSGHYSTNSFLGMSSGGGQGHIRKKMFKDADPNPPTARNPQYQGQGEMWIEGQNDYAQEAAKNYGTQEEHDHDVSLHKANKRALTQQYTIMYTGAVNKIMDALEQKWNSILPTDEELSQFIGRMLSQDDINNLTAEEQQVFIAKYRAFQMGNSDILADLLGVIESIRDKYITESDPLKKIAPESVYTPPQGALIGDARTFEWLDKRAAQLIAENLITIPAAIANDLNNLSSTTHYDINSNIFKALTDLKGDGMAFLRMGTNTASGSTAGTNLRTRIKDSIKKGTMHKAKEYGFRVAWMPETTKELLTEIEHKLNVAELLPGSATMTAGEQLASATAWAEQMFDDMQKVHQASITLDLPPIKQVTGLDRYDAQSFIGEFTEYYRNLTGSNPKVDITSEADPNYDFHTFNLAGQEADVTAIEPLLKQLLTDYIINKGRERSVANVENEISNLKYEIENLKSSVGGNIRLTNSRAEHEIHSYEVLRRWQNAGNSVLARNPDGTQETDPDIAATISYMEGYGVLSPEAYVKKAWNAGYPRMELWTQNTIHEDNKPPNDPPTWKYDEYLEKYSANKPRLLVGKIPVAWDDDGKVTDTVNMNITKATPTSDYVMTIDGEEVSKTDDWYWVNSSYGDKIRNWYQSKQITPHTSSPYGAHPEQETKEQELAAKQQERDQVRDEFENRSEVMDMIDGLPEKFTQSGSYGDMSVAFDHVIEFQKRSGIQERYLIERNEQWRVAQIVYQFADLARRGVPRMFLMPGTASMARGAFGYHDTGEAQIYTVRTDKIEWSLEKKTIRGLERDVIIINANELNEPLWVDVTKDGLVIMNPDKKIPDTDDEIEGYFSGELTAALGRYVAEDIAKKLKQAHGNTAADTDQKLLISHTGANEFVIHNVYGVLIGTAGSQAGAEALRNQELVKARATAQPATIKGTVTKEEVNHPIHLIKNEYTGSPPFKAAGRYKHTLARPTLEGGRRNYDLKLLRNLRAYAKRFGMKLESGKINVGSANVDLGNIGMGLPRVVSLDSTAAQQFKNIQIEEVTGENYGFIVNSDGGLVLPNVFTSESDAQEALAAWIGSHSVPEDGVLEVYQLTMSDEAIDHHEKGGLSPFATAATSYKDNPFIESARKKIGSNEPSLVDRFKAWRKTWKDELNQGVFDRFWGVRSALKRTGQEYDDAADDPYVAIRMTTGLETMMRGVMEFGHPVWKDGIVENEGQGLLKILEPVAGDVELWAMYMAGVRAKRLLTNDNEGVWKQLMDPNTSEAHKQELISRGREKNFSPDEIDAMIQLGDENPMFKDVAKKYAAFNKQMLDFAEESGVINPKTRALWEHADYIPFYRIADDRLIGPLAKGVGVANQNSPIKTLKGGTANVGDLVHNIFMNMTNLMDSSIKNRAALMAVDALKDTGIIQKQAMAVSRELVPMSQVGKILKQHGMDTASMPSEVLDGLQTMFAIQPPEGKGIIAVMRDGRKEFYYTEDELLYRALSSVNMKSFGAWMNLLRGPKRLLTTWVTLDPGFMLANYVRDSMSAFVLGRDNFIPIASGMKGFVTAVTEGESMRAMIGSGAAFESGYLHQGDPKAAGRMVEQAMKDAGFQRTVLNSPRKLFNAWKRLGSATENANRIAVYEAAIRAGKSKAQASYESKDLMDFSMSGDWGFIQFLVQSVPFMGARLQGLQRLGRGAAENPVGFLTKGLLVSMAGMALWFAFRDDERYKALEEWDKDAYFHWWLGDQHFRLPKGFEVGAIFNTIPERIFEYMYSKENDAGQLLMRRWGHMLGETFNLNPIPQTIRPFTETLMNKNWFTKRNIEQPYEEELLPPDRHRYYTSPTMIELANAMPEVLDKASPRIRSPLQLQNLYHGYTGTLGRYLLEATDALVRETMSYPERPDRQVADYPVIGRFYRGDAPRRTKYENEFYNQLRTTIQIMNSLRRADRLGDDARFDELEEKYAAHIDVAGDLEGVRREISALNREAKEINLDEKMSGEEKRRQINIIQEEKNEVFKEAHKLRPSAQPDTPTTGKQDIKKLIDTFNVDIPEGNEELKETAPKTAQLLESVTTMPPNQLEKLEKASNYTPRE